MIVAGLISYYIFATLLLVGVAGHALWQNKRDAQIAFAQLQHDLQTWERTLPIPPTAEMMIVRKTEANFSAPETHNTPSNGVNGMPAGSSHSKLIPRE
jgi:hypothetical protein